jgi:hypothetical protein
MDERPDKSGLRGFPISQLLVARELCVWDNFLTMKNKVGWALSAVVVLGCMLDVGHAELREFEDKFGRIIRAELVSHKGSEGDTITIKKADGKSFEVKIDLFSEKDRVLLREWMKKVPATVSYGFRFEVAKQKASASASFSYDLKITNLSRDTVEGLTLKVRTIYRRSLYSSSNYIPYGDDYYGYGSGLLGKEESVPIPGKMKFNQTASFSTEAQRYSEGVLIQVIDAKGEVVGEHRRTGTKLASLKWEDGKQRKKATRGTKPAKPRVTVD